MKMQHWEEKIIPEERNDLYLDDHKAETKDEYDLQGYNNVYARDKARIVHSAHFRRLQGKTQVLGLGESDFYRTRLTHSIEVAQIGTGVLAYLEKLTPTTERIQHFKEKIKNSLPQKELIETICLAHDIGHPPFGHGGEVALNYCMHEFGGFEGNAQTLRICSTLGEFYKEGNKASGFNLTKRSLLGLIKYPAPFEKVTKQKYPTSGQYKEFDLKYFKPPKCIYNEDVTILEKIFSDAKNKEHLNLFLSIKKGEKDTDHSKTKYKSFDTSIMEIADDIAYGVHDLEDAVALNLVSFSEWDEFIQGYQPKQKDNPEIINNIKKCEKTRTALQSLFSRDSYERKQAVSALVKYFIFASEVDINDFIEIEDIEKNNYEPLITWKVIMKQKPRQFLDLLQAFVVERVIKSVEVQTLEFKGEQIIKDIFTALKDNPQRLLHRKYLERYNTAKGSTPEETKKLQMRIICDYVSGMTDEYAVRLYSRLFVPSHGSIFHKL